MKVLFYISLILIFTACGQKLKKKVYLNTDVKYSCYLWHLNEETYKFEFYLASYIHIDSSGNYELQRHTIFMDKAQYFAGTLSDSTKKMIDSILVHNKYFPEIRTDGLIDTPLIIYDGFTYFLDYKNTGKDRTKIQYINSSSRTPENILFLTSLLDTIVYKKQATKIDSFTIGAYVDTLKKISSYNLPPPPKRPPPPKIDGIKFEQKKN